MSGINYVSTAVKNMEGWWLSMLNHKLSPRAYTHMSVNFVPELDDSNKSSAEDVQYYQELISVF